jgi:hypothetical protein
MFSSPLVASQCPSPLSDTLDTDRPPTLKICASLPNSTSHRRTEKSSLPLAIHLPSPLMASAVTGPVCPLNVRISLPRLRSQTRTL